MSQANDMIDASDRDELDALAAEALKALEASSGAVGGTSDNSRVLSMYHVSAAVLSTFDERTLVPFRESVGASAFADSGKDTLFADGKLVHDRDGKERWTLLLDVRRAVLSRLGTAANILRVIDANRQSRPVEDSVQEMFERYLRGAAPSLSAQTSSEIAGTLQVVEWLDGLDIVKDLPTIAAVRERSEFLALIQPFYDIAGGQFAGRVSEMSKLRDYVGVMPPGSVREHINRIAAQIFKLQEKPPLFIWGPGGRGKSTLVLRFLWEHATLPDTERFPWVYLDFDRPGLLAEEPLTLLVEALRQLGIQYPEARASCEGLRRTWVQKLSNRPPEFRQLMSKSIATAESARASTLSSSPTDHIRCLQDFARLLGNFKLDSDPCLFVLDTFEEVQYRSEVVVKSLWQFLELFQENVPRLRTVIAGRSRLPGSWSLPRFELELDDFDAPAAMSFLQMTGISDVDGARKVFEFAGGNPLSLRLAAETWLREGGRGFEQSLPRKLFSFFVKDNAVQAQLFARVLDHIHDPDVRKLAYPGMVLRRITADIIKQVLAKSAGVDVPDEKAAERLFREMAREVALITVEGEALVHRADVRRIVINALRAQAPLKVREVEEAAVNYHAARSEIMDLPQESRILNRAEEIYHRLSLQQPLSDIGQRWLTGIEPHLFSALEELPAREHAWLASRVGRSLTPEERHLADLDAWERDTLQLSRELVRTGKPEKALAAMRERADRLPGSSLYSLEAEVLETLERWDELGRLVKIGIDSADAVANRDLAIDLRVRCARVGIYTGTLQDARSGLEEAAILAKAGVPVRAIEVGLHQLALLRAESVASGSSAQDDSGSAAIRYELKKQLDSLDDNAIRERTALMAWLAVEEAATEPEVVKRIAPLIGLNAESPSRLRSLAASIASFDSVQPVAGALADAFGAPAAGTLTERWTQLVLTSSSLALGKVVADLLTKVTPSPEVTASIVDVLRGVAQPCLVPGDTLAIAEKAKAEQDLTFTRDLDIQPSSLRRAASGARIDRSEFGSLARALVRAFPTRKALAAMVDYKLGRGLDSFSLEQSQKAVVSELILAADREGWLPQLIAAARESNPQNSQLQEVASEYELATRLPETQTLEQLIGRHAPFFDPITWREQLGLIESQVCRVELGEGNSGTGFLVGPDLVMTAFHVIEPVIAQRVAPEAITLRFDFRQRSDNSIITSGTPHRLATENWLVAYSPMSRLEADGSQSPQLTTPNQLDYAIVRLMRPAGVEPVGGDRSEPGAPPRRWMRITGLPDLDNRQPLAILQYPHNGPLKLTLGKLVGINVTHTRVWHDVATSTGSSGAPCFDGNWNLVGMHLGGRMGMNFAVPVSAIALEPGAQKVLNQTLP